jgi:hypothetical protein
MNFFLLGPNIISQDMNSFIEPSLQNKLFDHQAWVLNFNVFSLLMPNMTGYPRDTDGFLAHSSKERCHVRKKFVDYPSKVGIYSKLYSQ